MKTIEYTFSRLCFKADVIESLDDNDVFIVHTCTQNKKLSRRKNLSLQISTKASNAVFN